MLHRLLFIAGMTVGVMTPLVWMAYVSRPAPHGTSAPAVATAVSSCRARTGTSTDLTHGNERSSDQAYDHGRRHGIHPTRIDEVAAGEARILGYEIQAERTAAASKTCQADTTAFETRKPHAATSHGAPK